MLKNNKIGLIEMICATLLMGTVGYFVLESGQKSYNVVFFRCLFGAIFLFLYCWLWGHFKNNKLNGIILLKIALSGLFLILNWVLLFSSFTLSSLSTATVVYNIQPFFFMIIWACLMREKIAFIKLIWTVVAFCGLVFVSNVSSSNISFTSTYLQGITLALLAALFWAISAVMVKKITNIKPYLVVLIQLITGTVILYPFTDMLEISNISYMQWSHLVTLGAVHSCLIYILMYSAYQKLTAVNIAVLTFIYPAVAIVIDFFVYGKILTSYQWIGVFLILLSSIAVNLPYSLSFPRKNNNK